MSNLSITASTEFYFDSLPLISDMISCSFQSLIFYNILRGHELSFNVNLSNEENMCVNKIII